MRGKGKVDEIDRHILRLVQQKDMCVPKVTRIAKEMDLPTTTIHSRIRRLEREGVLSGYRGMVDAKKVDAGLTLFAVVKVVYAEAYAGKEKMYDYGKQLAKLGAEIMEVHACSGDWDYLLKLKFKDTEAYHKFQSEKILGIGGIEKLESKVVYKTFKESPCVKV